MEQQTQLIDLQKVRLDRSPFSRSRVDIIIPYHGQFGKVAKLIYSIVSSVKSNPYQITLVDDASPKTKEGEYFAQWFKDFDPVEKRPRGTESIVKFVRSETQLGYGGALALGFQHTVNSWALFMHSDCYVEDPNWMIEMGRSLMNLKDSKVRMVGARSPKISDGADERQVAVKSNKVHDILLDDSFLSLHCFMCHRELFTRIHGFIRPYPMTGYEDEEIAYRMKFYGYKQAICGRAWVNHEGRGTIGPLLEKKPELISLMDGNRERCINDLKSLYTKKIR